MDRETKSSSVADYNRTQPTKESSGSCSCFIPKLDLRKIKLIKNSSWGNRRPDFTNSKETEVKNYLQPKTFSEHLSIPKTFVQHFIAANDRIKIIKKITNIRDIPSAALENFYTGVFKKVVRGPPGSQQVQY